MEIRVWSKRLEIGDRRYSVQQGARARSYSVQQGARATVGSYCQRESTTEFLVGGL